ncbi:papilin b, proteoglycan-like sulfated glycoprotein [Antennarius striatus]|uniref:papilin b, proteoglycan-like sulfated glycoprotein n=1 Tax=Antennarius striatus TaxID=241820 RepID=UPI0035AF3A1A
MGEQKGAREYKTGRWCLPSPVRRTSVRRVDPTFQHLLVNMNLLHVLGVLLMSGAALPLPQPFHDHWGQFGAYGPCSRSCGTGVATRTRKCITSRTDGGHNCVGSSKSFQTCNTHECSVGSRDFRAEQCSQFDGMDFQGKLHTWVPHYGASNACELNCSPRGGTFFYRHRPAVVDGTPCYAGRSDICVDGVCRILVHGEFMGLDDGATPVDHTPPPVVLPDIRQMLTYVYRTGVFGECSASCDGGMQYRSLECWVQDPVNPHVVDRSYCINQLLQRPPTQQACNMHHCGAQFSVSSFSGCSVTCGEGQQTREVTCVGPGGEPLVDHACRGLARPPAAQICHRPSCRGRITWHVTEYGLCTRSCGGGVRERRVGCFDTDLNPHPDVRCGMQGRPVSVETCNSQPCPRMQTVPSVQDPRGHQSGAGGFMPYPPDSTYEPAPPVIGPQCAMSLHGCCPDGHTSATGPQNRGCPQDDCLQTRFGCCLDGLTPARGFGRAGCPGYQTPVITEPTPPPPAPPSSDICSLLPDEGPCDTWKVRFHFDAAASQCSDFWYGGCQGNGNNFVSLEECQRRCGSVVREPPPGPRRPAPGRGSSRSG